MLEKIVIATNNLHKREEIAAAMPGIEILLPEQAGVRFSHEESGATFRDNAIGKAHELHTQIKLPVLSDDSGICVPVLNGQPGIFSARFGADQPTPPKNDTERNAYLLSLLPPGGPHEAFFVCSMVLYFNEYRFYIIQETVHGKLIHEPKGENGFGYDPIFYIPELGKTAAELSMREKNNNSHRGRAVKKIRALLEREEKSGNF